MDKNKVYKALERQYTEHSNQSLQAYDHPVQIGEHVAIMGNVAMVIPSNQFDSANQIEETKNGN